MKRIIVICTALMLLVGCSTLKRWFGEERVVIQTQKVDVPVFVCPGNLADREIPNRPDFLIYELVEEDKNNPGKVGKAYKGSMLQALQHIEILEAMLTDVELVCENPRSE